MNIEIMTRNQVKAFIKEEIEKKFRKELDLVWKHINKLSDEIKIKNG